MKTTVVCACLIFVGISVVVAAVIISGSSEPKQQVSVSSEQEGTKSSQDLISGILGTVNETLEELPLDDEDSEKNSLEKQSTTRTGEKKSTNFFGSILSPIDKVIRGGDDKVQQVLGMSSDEESLLGRRLHKSINENSEINLVEDLATIKKLVDAAAPFMQSLKRPKIPYTFSVISNNDVNAFALPGGFVYVNTGLLDKLSNDDELRFVIGHEIAHVDLGHCAKAFNYAFRVGQLTYGVGENATLTAYKQYALSYSEDQEYEADEYGYRGLQDNGYQPEGAISFLRKLEAIEIKRSNKGRAGSNEGDAGNVFFKVINDHFRSHPPTSLRIQRLRNLG